MAAIMLIGVTAASGCGDHAGPFPEPVDCSTNSTWSSGNEESPLMHPGSDCIGCHTSEGEGPAFTIAGTVMNDFHDDTDCNGVEGVTVEVTGGDGKKLTLVTNAAGNFFSEAPVVMPFSAHVVLPVATRAMTFTPSTGACASCHSSVGASGAPGRIVVPR